MLEFENEEDIKRTEDSWNTDHFGGNSGLVEANERNCTGLVKFVYDDIEEEEITNHINQDYPGNKHELFKRGGVFTGMIKVTFSNEDQLKQAITNKFKIGRGLYITEPFKHKPRVIKCNTCQRFGHVSRLCRSKDKPVCGKCTKDHETKDCTADESEYKCYHCSKTDHITGSHTCHIVKEKLQELLDRQNG